MEQSMIAAVSGIDANQTYLNVISNNIANADTVGYKSQDVVFTNLLAQQVAGATAPSPTAAGTNAIAVGAGVQVGAMSTSEGEGAMQQTGNPTDVAIVGNGYLISQQNGQQLYTRAGNLTVDGNGHLATATGGLVLGWEASATGAINTNAPVGAITIPTGQMIPAAATSVITLGGNLPAWNGTGTPPVVTTTKTAYDGEGNAVQVTLTLTGVAGTANTWTMQGTVPDGTSTTNLWSTTSPPTITFDPATGSVASVSGATTNTDGSLSLPVTTMPPNYTFPAGDTWSINFPAPNSSAGVTQFAGEQTFQAVSQNGNASGTLDSFTIGGNGVITGTFSNGLTQAIGEIALAGFSNPSGLVEQGNSMYAASPNSGTATIATPGTNALGTLVGGSLEMSNVDLASQLTDLIQAQEDYQANSKVITTTDTVLQSLMSIP